MCVSIVWALSLARANKNGEIKDISRNIKRLNLEADCKMWREPRERWETVRFVGEKPVKNPGSWSFAGKKDLGSLHVGDGDCNQIGGRCSSG